MRLGAILLIPLALASCKAGDDSDRKEPVAVAAADGLCLPGDEARRLQAIERPVETDALRLINHYAICHQDDEAARAVATRLAHADVPAAIHYIAVVNLNTSRDLDTVVPLLERASGLGNEASTRELRHLMTYTAVADAFGTERIRPKVAIEVPARFTRPTASRVVEVCSAADADAREFCDLAIGQVMIETRACRGQPRIQSMAATRSRIAQAKPASGQTAFDFIRASLNGCAADDLGR